MEIATGLRSLLRSAEAIGLRFFLCEEVDRGAPGLRETTKLLSRFVTGSRNSFEAVVGEVVDNNLLLVRELFVVGMYGLRVDVVVVVVDVN